MQSIAYLPVYERSWALVIGINNYTIASQLSLPRNDAEAVAAILEEGFGFPEGQINVLKDAAATKEAILDAYLGFRTKADSENDRLFVFFSGHGATMTGLRGQFGFLVPVDGDPDNPATLISWDDFTRYADLIPAKHVLYVMDACFSGLMLTKAVPPGTNRFVADMLQRRARQVITAGKADEPVSEGGGPRAGNSVFTGFLLEGLEGAAADEHGVITANGLMYYTYRQVSQHPDSGQTPHYGHFDGDGDFIFQVPDGDLRSGLRGDFLVQTVPTTDEIALDTPSHAIAKPPFHITHGYGDPGHPSFGRNDWSAKLGEIRAKDGEYEVARAYSWLALIMEPILEQTPHIDLTVELKRLSDYKPVGSEPYARFTVPRTPRTTIDSVILFDRLRRESERWERYLRFDVAGNIEFAETYPTIFEFNGTRSFKYVQTIGLIWQFLHFGSELLGIQDYRAGARLVVNLVGTRNTILSDFASESKKGGPHWTEPLSSRTHPWDRSSLLTLQCTDLNLQLKYDVITGSLDEMRSKGIVDDVAQLLGLAYNHQSEPRCYIHGTDEFPWNQYFRGRR